MTLDIAANHNRNPQEAMLNPLRWRAGSPTMSVVPVDAKTGRRLLYSLLKSSVQFARLAGIDRREFEQLAELAYFEESRRNQGNLQQVSEELGISLRKAAMLSKRLKRAFFSPERQVESVRTVAESLMKSAKSKRELADALPQLEARQLERAIEFMQQQDWIIADGEKLKVRPETRIFAADEWSQKIDALNDYLRAITQTVWRKLALNDEAAVARTWTIVGQDKTMANLAQDAIKSLRHRTIDVEEAAFEAEDARKFSVVISVTPIEGDSDE